MSTNTFNSPVWINNSVDFELEDPINPGLSVVELGYMGECPIYMTDLTDQSTLAKILLSLDNQLKLHGAIVLRHK